VFPIGNHMSYSDYTSHSWRYFDALC